MSNYPTYQQLYSQHGDNLTYLELLQTQEWRCKRASILQRDNYTCSVCARRETLPLLNADTGLWQPHEVHIPATCRQYNWQMRYAGTFIDMSILYDRDIEYLPVAQHRRMHVHHRLYIYDRLPWQYADKYLSCMCENCHHRWHQQHRVKVYRHTPEGYLEMNDLTPCKRCAGAGRLPQYDHVEAGICFRCWGACFEEWITPALRARSKQVHEKMKN
ncbi:hypothetical protein [Phnomibacter sp. MR]|uniref:hypothetical protein n=1 Tax=Phnomibacter sp. MR TaxID=3042318 RepID=UPI003A80691C